MTKEIHWKSELSRLPDWVRHAFKLLGRRYDYIAYRLANNVDDFLSVKSEIEKKLMGTNFQISNFKYDAFEQRKMFLVEAIKHADYFRPVVDWKEVQIPKALIPKSRPSAIDDLKFQSELQKKIIEGSRSLAIQLRQYGCVSQRLGTRQMDCDPFELLHRVVIQTRDDHHQYGLESIFDEVLLQRQPSGNPSEIAAKYLDHLAEIVDEENRKIIHDSLCIGMGSRKSNYYFYDAFNNWLSENLEETGGFIPTNFDLTDQCWAVLLTSLTFNHYDARSVQMYRTRSAVQKDICTTSRFDMDKHVESWSKNITK